MSNFKYPQIEGTPLSKTELYKRWAAMRKRGRSTQVRYRYCTVCDEWESDFMIFREWAINNGYKKGLSLDRIDNTKGYFPENCRWVSLNFQFQNKRESGDWSQLPRAIELYREGFSMSKISKELNLNAAKLSRELKKAIPKEIRSKNTQMSLSQRAIKSNSDHNS